MIFLTSDQHFDHANIIKYTNRPFNNVDDMNEALIFYWNLKVSDDDMVYHLGDFCLGNTQSANKFLARLNGDIHILGNPWHHDARWLPKFGNHVYKNTDDAYETVTIEPPIVILEGVKENGGGRGIPAVLCHYPILNWDRMHYDSYHFFGHSHGATPWRLRALDGGVDNIAKLTGQYRPVGLGEAISLSEKEPE